MTWAGSPCLLERCHSLKTWQYKTFSNITFSTRYMDEVPVATAPKAAPRKREAKSKCWCFTMYHFTIGESEIPHDQVQYLIHGEEVCPDTGRDHLQCFVHLKKEERFSTLQKAYPHWQNLAKIKGTPWQNYLYCAGLSESKKHLPPNKIREWGERPTETHTLGKADAPFAEALAAPTVAAGIAIVKEKRPRDWCLHGESIERALKKAKVDPFKHLYVPDDFNVPIQNVVKSTLFVGETKMGKTHYALAHFSNPLLVRHIDGLKKLSPDNDGIVFDDMSFRHWPTESVIHLLDWELASEINVRYGTLQIPARTRKIFTHNNASPFYNSETIDPLQKEAIDGRLQICNFNHKLF